MQEPGDSLGRGNTIQSSKGFWIIYNTDLYIIKTKLRLGSRGANDKIPALRQLRPTKINLPCCLSDNRKISLIVDTRIDENVVSIIEGQTHLEPSGLVARITVFICAGDQPRGLLSLHDKPVRTASKGHPGR
jgi:hypothetical protein